MSTDLFPDPFRPHRSHRDRPHREQFTRSAHDLTNHSKLPKGILDYAEVTSGQSGITDTEVDLTGLSVTVDVEAGRIIRVSCVLQLQGTASGGEARIRSYVDGSDARRLVTFDLPSGTDTDRHSSFALYTPSSGSHTFKLTGQSTTGGEFDISANAEVPSLLLVEDIGPA